MLGSHRSNFFFIFCYAFHYYYYYYVYAKGLTQTMQKTKKLRAYTYGCGWPIAAWVRKVATKRPCAHSLYIFL